MNCNLYFYKLPFNLNGKNWKMEDIEAYVQDHDDLLALTFTDYQFLRIDKIEQTIKLNMSQTYQFNIPQLIPQQNTKKPNYLRVVFHVGTRYDTYFYKITKWEQIAQMTMEATIVLDVLNTYTEGVNYNLSSSTLILRMHKDRFNEYSFNEGYCLRMIDKYPEEISATLFKHKEEYIYFERRRPSSTGTMTKYHQSWYLVYLSNDDPVNSSNDTESKYVNPVRCLVASDNGYRVSMSAQTGISVRIDTNLSQFWNDNEEVLAIRDFDNDGNTISIVIGGTTYTLVPRGSYSTNQFSMILFRKQNNTDTTFKVYGYQADSSNHWTVTSIGTFAYFDISHCQYCLLQKVALWGADISNYTAYFVLNYDNSVNFEYFIGSGNQEAVNEISTKFSDIDLTNPKLVKIICLPYAPMKFLNGNVLGVVNDIPSNIVWNSSMKLLEITDVQTHEFCNYIEGGDFGYSPFYDLETTLPETLTHYDTISAEYESKLYHSDFYQVKFVYDSFSFLFQLEYVNPEDNDEFDTSLFRWEFYCNHNLVSKFMFKFPDYIVGKYEIQDYNNCLLVERNNEITLYTNAYLNYLRLGYNFDVKNKEQQNVGNVVGVVLSTLGSIASFASSIYTGGAGIVGGVSLLTTATGGTIRAIQQAQQSDRNIAQKKLELQNQSVAVSSNTDIEFLKEYGKNCGKLVYYGLSSVMENAMLKYFHLFGYATRIYDNKTYTSTYNRRIHFNFYQAELDFENYQFGDNVAEEIKKAYKDGVTYFHQLNDDENGLHYEYTQDYENWEKALYDIAGED